MHRLRFGRAGRYATVVVLVAAVTLGVGAVARTGSRAQRAPVIHGYLYASRCPAAGSKDVADRWGMYLCNCTSYVAWALHANGQRTDWFIRGSMDAWNWPNVARRRGLRIESRPRVGDVADWPELGRFGHVAYVTRVRGDGTFDVAEYNLPRNPSHRFRFDMRTGVSRSGATFIDVPRK